MGFYFTFAASTSLNGEDSTASTDRDAIRVLDDFYYPPQTGDVSYPSCRLDKEFAIPGQDTTYMNDYNFMAGIAYESTNVTDYVLDTWFLGQDVWVDEADFVAQWRKDSGHENSHVSFKLFSKSDEPGVGILSIRGTETPTDRLFNIQLYIGTMLTSLVRAIIPFSWLWDDVYADLIATTDWIASDHLQESSYYRITTEFANDLLRNNYTYDGKSFHWLRTTGVSLGGGLALITGAQSDAFGLAISGMNPTLMRKSLDPPVSIDTLNAHLFNVIADNDPLGHLGDPIRNHQSVNCRTWPSEAGVNCHSFWRIMCEFLYMCGSSEDRGGTLCICHEKWGYPEPLPRSGTNRTLDQACKEEKQNFIDATGQGQGLILGERG